MSAAEGESQFEATQQEATQQEFPFGVTQRPSEQQESQPANDVWGRLMPVGGGKVVELKSRELRNGVLNEYVLGRGERADWKLDEPRVSSRHCRIFCERSENAFGGAELLVFVEDMSSNGTYVNQTVQLRKGQKRQLHTGDEISLLNPVSKCKDGKRAAALAVLSFTFVNLHDRVTKARRQQSIAEAVIPAKAARGAASGPSARAVEDVYDIREVIGRGTCGQVHRAFHRQTGAPWAVKAIEMRKFALTPGLSLEEIVQEAEMLRAITHPYVIRLEEVFQSASGNAVYLVMELVEGGDLLDRILERGKYAEARAQQLMERVLTAVDYLHSNNIVHRDLKPENILLMSKTSDIDVKITDFGLAKRTTRDGLKTFCGTPQYFAPEVLKRRNTVAGVGRYGREADMWSLGVILYILLSGFPPFSDHTLFDQIQNACYSLEGAEWEVVSACAKDLIRQLLTASPITRFTAHQAIAHPWIAAVHAPAAAASSSFDQTCSEAKRPPTVACAPEDGLVATVTVAAQSKHSGETSSKAAAVPSAIASPTLRAAAASVSSAPKSGSASAKRKRAHGSAQRRAQNSPPVAGPKRRASPRGVSSKGNGLTTGRLAPAAAAPAPRKCSGPARKAALTTAKPALQLISTAVAGAVAPSCAPTPATACDAPTPQTAASDKVPRHITGGVAFANRRAPGEGDEISDYSSSDDEPDEELLLPKRAGR